MKQLYLVTLLFVLCFNNYTHAQTPSWLWASVAVGYNNSQPQSIALDNNGNVYIAGSFIDSSITFGNYTLVNAGLYNIFLAKFDKQGNALWAIGAGGTGTDEATGVSTDASGNVYMTGYFSSPDIYFGNTTLNNPHQSNLFIAKFDSAGNSLWAKTGGTSAIINSNSIYTDANGNSYITGDFQGPTLSLGSKTLSVSSYRYSDIFIAKYDASGNVVWASFGESYNSTATSVSVAPDGNSYITGGFFDTVMVFGTDTLLNTGYNSIFTARFGPTGNFVWAKSASSEGHIQSQSISSDTSGNCYITGFFSSPGISFGNITLANNYTSGYNSSFITKYDKQGNLLWAKPIPGENDANCIHVGAEGYNYITGAFNGPYIVFGNDTFTNHGQFNFFAAKYDPSGNAIWATCAGNYYDDETFAITSDAYGNAYIAGGYNSNTVILGSDTLQHPVPDGSDNGAQFTFVAKLGYNFSTYLTGSICSGSLYNFNGRELDTAGIYFDTLTNVHHGDSIIELNLTELYPYHNSVFANICQGDTFQFNDSSFTATGVHTGNFTSVNGCDSIVDVHLTVNSYPVVSLSWQAMVQAGELLVEAGDTVICSDPELLIGGSPLGGTYSGNLVSGDSLYFISFITGDTITYTVTTNGCTASASNIISPFDCGAGIAAINLEKVFSLYPNPIIDILTIQSNSFLTNKVTPVIYDITGKQVVVDYSRQGDTFTFTTTTLSAGVYLVSMNVDGSEMVKRFVKLN